VPKGGQLAGKIQGAQGGQFAGKLQGPPVYDYGVNVVYQGDEVYVDGQSAATAQEYSQQAIALANTPATQPPPPSPPEPGQQADWLPMGVWALAQEEKGDATMFFQISIDKDGVVSGAYQNVLSGEKSPISGQVDKKTQRVAWKIGSNIALTCSADEYAVGCRHAYGLHTHA
jgi:hypothetical protein